MIKLTDHSFNTIFADQTGDKLAYVLFHQRSCVHCAEFLRSYRSFSSDKKNQLDCVFYTADLDDCPQGAAGLKIMGTPTLLVWKRGQIVCRVTGVVGMRVLETDKKKMKRM